jgi:5S rRNA maturation endonuclease (ribonuclease M5)
MNIAVLSGTSGSFREMSKIVIPKNLNVYVATDPDEQGEQYASLIHKAVAPHTVYRLNLDELE